MANTVCRQSSEHDAGRHEPLRVTRAFLKAGRAESYRALAEQRLNEGNPYALLAPARHLREIQVFEESWTLRPVASLQSIFCRRNSRGHVVRAD
jgi:hypothetical protein